MVKIKGCGKKLKRVERCCICFPPDLLMCGQSCMQQPISLRALDKKNILSMRVSSLDTCIACIGMHAMNKSIHLAFLCSKTIITLKPILRKILCVIAFVLRLPFLPLCNTDQLSHIKSWCFIHFWSYLHTWWTPKQIIHWKKTVWAVIRIYKPKLFDLIVWQMSTRCV